MFHRTLASIPRPGQRFWSTPDKLGNRTSPVLGLHISGKRVNQALELVETTKWSTTNLYEAQFSFAYVSVTLLATARFFREAFVSQSQYPPPRRMVNAN